MVFNEISPWHVNNPTWCAILIGVTVFFFYFLSNLQYWMFGWKYWVTAVEMQALVEQQNAGKFKDTRRMTGKVQRSPVE